MADTKAFFPEFSDGDVKLVVTGSRQYQLHSGVLKNASPVMRELLVDENAAKLLPKAVKAGVSARYKLVLVNNPELDDDTQDIAYVLEPVRLDNMGRPKPGQDAQGVGGFELENGRRVPPIFVAYDAVLGAMYNQPINLGDSQEDGLADLLSNAFQVTVVAEYLDCIRIVSKPIEATLLATGQNLYRAISANPLPWLTFAARVKSRAIFKEALIHAAGKFNQPDVQMAIQNGEVPEDVLEVLSRKGKWVQRTVSDSTRYLASYYPSMLLREVRPGDKDNVSRASYGNDIMMWMAICIFRHWVCDLMASERTHHAPDLGWGFIKAICKGGDAYLSRHMLQHNFHVRFPMTGKGMACVEHRLAEVKDDVKQWAVPLMKNNSSLDVGQNPISHFVHVNVHNQDFPWVVAEQAIKEEPQQEEEEQEDEEEEYEEDDEGGVQAGGFYQDGDEIPELDEDYDMEGGDSPVFDTAGAGADDYEGDTEPYDEEEERQMMERYRNEKPQERKMKTLRPGQG